MASVKNKQVITGVSINVFVESQMCQVVSNIQVGIRRDIQPVYSMAGNPNPIAFSYQTRRIGGMIEFINLDGVGAMALIPDDYRTYLSLTEGLSVQEKGSDEEAIGDDLDFSEADKYDISLGESNPLNIQRSTTQINDAITNYLANSETTDEAGNRHKGTATFQLQKPTFLDQAMNLHVSFFAMQEATGVMYSRAIFGMSFHTHNIAIGIQVGATEEGHYFASYVTNWKKSINVASNANTKKGQRSYILPTEANPYAQESNAVEGNASAQRIDAS